MRGRAGNCGTWLGLHEGDASGLGWKVMETPSGRQGYSRGGVGGNLQPELCSDLSPALETLLPEFASPAIVSLTLGIIPGQERRWPTHDLFAKSGSVISAVAK